MGGGRFVVLKWVDGSERFARLPLPGLSRILFLLTFDGVAKLCKKRKILTTFNGGSLGSCIDEERSQLRYVV